MQDNPAGSTGWYSPNIGCSLSGAPLQVQQGKGSRRRHLPRFRLRRCGSLSSSTLTIPIISAGSFLYECNLSKWRFLRRFVYSSLYFSIASFSSRIWLKVRGLTCGFSLMMNSVRGGHGSPEELMISAVSAPASRK